MNQEEFNQRYGSNMSHPPLRLLLDELKIPVQAIKTAIDWRNLPREPIGHGKGILLLPGYGAHVKLMGAMKRYLIDLGFDARYWNLGVNDGDLRKLMPLVMQQVREFAGEKGEPIQMIGWSLGGYISKEVAREQGSDVSRVITLGTPVVGGPKYTAFLPVYKRRGIDVEKAANAVLSRYKHPIECAVVALYNQRDAIVASEACIDRFSPNVEHIEVKATHMAMAFSSEVFKVLFKVLQQKP